MKSLFLILLIIFAVSAPVAYFIRPYCYRIVNQFLTKSHKFSSIDFKKDLLYRLYTPRLKSDTQYPLIVTLHGAAERGNDNIKQIDGIASTFLSKKVQRKNPTFLLMPQCPKGTQWVNTGFANIPFGHYQQSSIPESPEMMMVIMVIKQLISKFPIDTSRIYVGGFSMGASGTWDIISRHPELFSAAFMMSGVSDTSTAERIKNIPIWAFTGELDNIAPPSLNREMCDAVKSAGGSCRHTIYKNTGHYCVNHALREPGFINWVFSKRKK